MHARPRWASGNRASSNGWVEAAAATGGGRLTRAVITSRSADVTTRVAPSHILMRSPRERCSDGRFVSAQTAGTMAPSDSAAAIPLPAGARGSTREFSCAIVHTNR